MADEMSDTEMWRAVHEDQAEQRARTRAGRTPQILELAELGHTVQQLTEYHFRIDNVLDLFPTRRRFHFLKTGERGGYINPKEVTARFLGRE